MSQKMATQNVYYFVLHQECQKIPWKTVTRKQWISLESKCSSQPYLFVKEGSLSKPYTILDSPGISLLPNWIGISNVFGVRLMGIMLFQNHQLYFFYTSHHMKVNDIINIILLYLLTFISLIIIVLLSKHWHASLTRIPALLII